jgi:hypothetical protein
MIFRLSGEVLTRTGDHDLLHADVRVLRAEQIESVASPVSAARPSGVNSLSSRPWTAQHSSV